MIKLVVFDWNATILADTTACFAADNHVIKVFGGKPIDLKTYRDTLDHPAVDFYARHGCDRKKLLAQSKKLGEIFHLFYEARAAKLRTRRGAREVLRWLKAHKIPMVILSNHTQSGIHAQLKRLRIKHYFKDILAYSELDSFLENKTKHARLKNYLKNRKLKKLEILLIGDSPEEVEVGRRIGAITVALTGGYYAEWRLKEKKPDYLIHNPKSLISIIKKINYNKTYE